MGGVLQTHRKNGRVNFVGTRDDAELMHLYSHDGMFDISFEAIPCQCPVMCSDIAALRETCGDAVPFCDARSPEAFGDEIRRVRSDKTLRESLLLAGTERLSVHSIERFRREKLEVLTVNAGFET